MHFVFIHQIVYCWSKMIYILKWHARPVLRTYANGIVEMLSTIRAVREASCPKTHFKLVRFTLSVTWGCGPTVAGVLRWEQKCSKFERRGNSHLILLFGLCSFSARWGKLFIIPFTKRDHLKRFFKKLQLRCCLSCTSIWIEILKKCL